jgi:hypothetical protein
MKAETIADPRVSLDRTVELLADEARHNLIRGVLRSWSLPSVSAGEVPLTHALGHEWSGECSSLSDRATVFDN